MVWLVRTQTKRKGSVVHSDDSVPGSTLTIGRAAGQGVFLSDLSVALEHARIVPLKGNRYRIESLIAAGVRVDGKLQQSAGAGYGTTLDIGNHRIEIIKAPKGFEHAVVVSELAQMGTMVQRAAVQARRGASSLSQTWLAKRSTSWILFCVAIVAGLVAPVTGFFMPEIGNTLREMPVVPSDHQWSAGSLQTAHHFFGQDCQNCHTKPFVRVKDDACTSCHQSTLAHADGDFFAVGELLETPCALCHRDHNGATGLISAEQSLCTDCHTGLDQTTGGRTILENVHDFGDSHPQFKVQLAAFDLDGQFAPRRSSLDSDLLIEDSNLLFPHDIHLDMEGINAPEGNRVLECGDCHAVEPGGGKMLPVDFETMCHDCHTLGFDPTAPDREVPHGDAPEVVFMMQEYYTNKALRGGVTDGTAPAVVRKRRRPGERVSREERMEILAWADERAHRVGQSMFEGRACGVCHRVERVETEGGISWDVAPVRVAGAWFPKAFFTHDSHSTMQCESCHSASASASSDDVLIPGIANCRQCHGGEDSKDKVPSPCIDCHVYHGYTDIVMGIVDVGASPGSGMVSATVQPDD